MVFEAGKNGGNFILSVSSVWLYLQAGFDFIKAGFICFKKSVLVRSKSVVGIVQTGR